MRALHIVKTSSGATWAALQAIELARLGVEIHVAIPAAEGSAIHLWREAGAAIHILDLDFPVRHPWRIPALCRRARELTAALQPDLIHAHHFGPAMLLRHALGPGHPTPRIFQVPGPLHLEHALYRRWDLAAAGPPDFWISTSRCVRDHYLAAGAEPSRVFLSYYGIRTANTSTRRTNALRRRLGISPNAFVAGNISYIYGPKYYLGQRTGVKRHEDMIAALGTVLRRRSDAVGVLIGGPWGNATRYFDRLKRLADQTGKGRILMPGHFPPSAVREFWPDFDCAIHVPESENCGGVVEPLLAEVPVIAADVGGLPEVIVNGVTGALIPPRNPAELATAILRVLDNPRRYRAMAQRGRHLVQEMFDVCRTAAEVYEIYCRILHRPKPSVEADEYFTQPVLS